MAVEESAVRAAINNVDGAPLRVQFEHTMNPRNDC
eukprot:CAMPEP_0172756808 /NCGR_PEP_ID=MMETSP1074-20121228/162491_1 /TAXON_ID=2916 /ORGANISM="Ceratium fusus, Strain PA161109" /LENGTH=34 /DNA_ID= /DNA_START= /DNA_END= /DNA_ORIENTATION=